MKRLALALLSMAACSSFGTTSSEDAPPSPPLDAGVETSIDAAPPMQDAGGDVDRGDGPSSSCPGDLDCQRVVFVSSILYSNPLGGIDGADEACNALAAASTHPRVKGRKFLAWLATSNVPPTSRMKAGSKSYIRPDQEPVATNWPALLQGPLLNPINVDEHGNTPTDTNDVWTGASSNGSFAGPACGGWGKTDGSGTVGRRDQTTDLWSKASEIACSTYAHIYCFEE